MSFILWPLRQFADLLLANDSPRQVAAGCAIGTVLGLVPKGNLMAIALAVLLMAVRVNRTAGLLTAFAFAGVGLWTDSLTHLIGERVLGVAALQDFYATLYDAPLGPWWGFNNTVVCGSFLLGVYLALPVYLAVKPLYAAVQPRISAWLLRYRVVRWLAGADWTDRLGVFE